VSIGPGDLSSDRSVAGNPDHPEVRKAIDEGIRRIKACGKAAGILTADEKLARRYLDMGVLFIAVASDIVVLARETEKIAAKYKG
jgi:4-hydroxy-2-oxoheptanedioate aldolase